jgi:hypothetical protein
LSNQNETNRVLNRMGARELTHDEIERVSAAGPPCRLTFSHLPGGGHNRSLRQASGCNKNEKGEKVCQDKKTTEYSQGLELAN